MRKSHKCPEATFNQEKTDCVTVVSSPAAEKLVPGIASIASNMGIRAKIMPRYLRTMDRQIPSTLHRVPAIAVSDGPLESLRNCILKRGLDIIVSLIAIITIHSWLMPLVGAMIRMTSKGPAIFRQKRIGKDGKEFVLYKFRTMTTKHHKSQEETLSGIGEITVKNDPRLTSIGKWLRKTNIDEFPQFFNVLIGNMSLAGPRPHMTSEDRELEERLENYPLRRHAKPGITGWAQISGFRGGTKDMTLMQKRTDHDIWYVKNWSFCLDLKIIAVTLWQMVTGRTGTH